MFDILAEQIDVAQQDLAHAETYGDEQHSGLRQLADIATASFRTINVLMIETRGENHSASIVEQCLRYMTRFECQITQAGSHAAAAFAMRSDSFDIVVTDEHCLDLIAQNGIATIVVTERPSSETTRKALKAGALHCLPLNDISPRLLETAITQALCCEP